MSKKKLHRRHFMAMTSAALAVPASAFQSVFTAKDQPWLGPDYWANPLQDWRQRNGRMECFVAGGDRNVYLLTRELSAVSGDFRTSVTLGRMEEDRGQLLDGFVGFRVGIRGHFNDYRDSAVRGFGLNAGLLSDGTLFIGTPKPDAPKAPLTGAVELSFSATPATNGYLLKLTAKPEGAEAISIEYAGAPEDWLRGGMALVCSSGRVMPSPRELPPLEPSGGVKPGTERRGSLRFWFKEWKVSGSKVTVHPERAFGPILFTMYTLSRGVLKLSAQMAPADAVTTPAILEVKRGGTWKQVATCAVDKDARTAAFRVEKWDDTQDHAYRVSYAGGAYEGNIRRDPRDKAKVVIGALTCNNDLAFPHTDICRSLQHFKPDILLFTGDQIYERVGEYGIQMEPVYAATLDYLRKWYLFGWAYRDLLRDIPTVCMPDDHDVYHGNVWGVGGKKAEIPSYVGAQAAVAFRTKAWQDSGGYKMPAQWVNAVQRTQTSQLPDPFDPTPVEQGIGVYYTSLNWAGISFAILEDRKWKSAPKAMLPNFKLENGWSSDPNYNAAKHGDAPGAELLGPRQIAFLEKWAQEWEGALLKIVVSQTIFCNVCTLPPPANTDEVTSRLPVQPLGSYPEGEMKAADHDSNGWPQSGRNRALRAMRKAVAFHVGGDQHLGSTVQYGIDDHNDGPWAICTPAISNVFPRRWFPAEEGANRQPGKPRYTGEFLDGFGNKMTIHAVANPHQFGQQPAALHDRAVGYGILELDRKSRNITMTNWPRYVDVSKPGAQPYPGWPLTVHPYDNGLKGAKYTLGSLNMGKAGAVIQVIDDSNGEIVYTTRVDGAQFEAKVFRPGTYSVRLDGGKVRKGLPARPV